VQSPLFHAFDLSSRRGRSPFRPSALKVWFIPPNPRGVLFFRDCRQQGLSFAVSPSGRQVPPFMRFRKDASSTMNAGRSSVVLVATAFSLPSSLTQDSSLDCPVATFVSDPSPHSYLTDGVSPSATPLPPHVKESASLCLSKRRTLYVSMRLPPT